MSATVFIVCSVPQGSVLGRRLFILYTADLVDKSRNMMDVSFRVYADDTQLYLLCYLDDIATEVRRLERCITHELSVANRLQGER